MVSGRPQITGPSGNRPTARRSEAAPPSVVILPPVRRSRSDAGPGYRRTDRTEPPWSAGIAIRRRIRLTAAALLAVTAAGAGLLAQPAARDFAGLDPLPSVAISPDPGASAPGPTPPAADPTADPTADPSTAPAVRPSSPYVPALVDRSGIQDRLQAALEEGRDGLAAPGVSAAILFPDGRMWTGVAGVADLATERPLTAATPFALASVSKTFLAAEILALAGEDLLTLDASVAALLTEVQVGGLLIDPAITIRQLLDHTSGLRDYLADRALDKAVRADPTAVWTPDRALAYAGTPVAPPGTRYHYANTNYVLLGLIAEQLTGRSLAAEFRSRFFEPFGLTSATYQGLEPPVSELPTAYRYSSGALLAEPTDVTDGTDIRPFTAITTAAGAAGSVASSAQDLARWARALYGGYALSEAAVAEMVGDADRTAALRPGYPYGLGVQVFWIDGRISFGHSGRLVGARSVLRWFPDEGLAIAVLTNQSRFDPAPILRDLFAVVAPERVGGGPTAD